MIEAQLHPQEQQRLASLLRYEVLDTEDEAAFDELTQLASTICGTPISLISLIDTRRQWFKSRVGLDATETSRSLAFCAHAILQQDIFQVSNALEDDRFSDNPLVTGPPDIRFYAGAPLVSGDGMPIGTLCVIDQEAKALSDEQLNALRVLAKQVINQLELRLHNKRLKRMSKMREQMMAVMAHDLRSPFNVILGMAKMLANRAERMTPERITDSAKTVLSSSVQVFQVLDELLQWSQQTLGDVKYNPQHVSLRAQVESAIELLRESAEIKGIAVCNDIPDDLQVCSDPSVIKTVSRNLMANAIKYSLQDGKIHIFTRSQENGVDVCIRDFGAGVPESVKKNLFKQSVDSTVGSKGETGLGLGLMLCQSFLEKQGGRLYLDESVREGSCFVFELPTSCEQLD